MTSFPNAKINIGLNIVERRPDGYHNIETIFYPIGLCDELSIEKIESSKDIELISSGLNVGEDVENNLVVKAFRLIQRHYNISSVRISLAKSIPFGAGLGGGSADAAFTLKKLNELFQLNLSIMELEHLASQLGADCPFFIQNKPVFATGIGNVFTPIDLSLQGYQMVLVKPDIHVSTPMAYAGVTPLLPKFSLLDLVKEPIESWQDSIVNDFEDSVFSQFPKIRELKEKLYDLGAIYASMSGSGSSVYGIFRSEPDVSKLKEQYPSVFNFSL